MGMANDKLTFLTPEDRTHISDFIGQIQDQDLRVSMAQLVAKEKTAEAILGSTTAAFLKCVTDSLTIVADIVEKQISRAEATTRLVPVQTDLAAIARIYLYAYERSTAASELN